MSILITAPLKSESGYGRKSREIVKPIVEKYGDEIQIANLSWGKTPDTALVDNEEYAIIAEKIKPVQLNERPDLHIHIGLPSEMKPNGHKNILFTSGAEVSMISYKWIMHINKHIDHVYVPSEFIRNIMVNSSYEDREGNELRMKVPVDVIPESYSNGLFEDLSSEEKDDLDSILGDIKEQKWFVTYGQVNRQKQIGAGRKNVSRLIQDFIKEFRGDNGVALVLKCNPINFSNLGYYLTKEYLERVIDDVGFKRDEIPSIYLIEGFLSDPQLYHLMNHDKVIGHVTTTHGEGFGRFLLEASLTGKPMIIPKVGSFRDFLHGNSIEYMDVELVDIPKESQMGDTIIDIAKWTEPLDGEVRRALREVYKNHKKMDGSKLAKENKETYYISNIEAQVLEAIDEHYSKKVNVVIPDIPD